MGEYARQIYLDLLKRKNVIVIDPESEYRIETPLTDKKEGDVNESKRPSNAVLALDDVGTSG